jgi:hypothetical protein
LDRQSASIYELNGFVRHQNYQQWVSRDVIENFRAYHELFRCLMRRLCQNCAVF